MTNKMNATAMLVAIGSFLAITVFSACGDVSKETLKYREITVRNLERMIEEVENEPSYDDNKFWYDYRIPNTRRIAIKHLEMSSKDKPLSPKPFLAWRDVPQEFTNASYLGIWWLDDAYLVTGFRIYKEDEVVVSADEHFTRWSDERRMQFEVSTWRHIMIILDGESASYADAEIMYIEEADNPHISVPEFILQDGDFTLRLVLQDGSLSESVDMYEEVIYLGENDIQ